MTLIELLIATALLVGGGGALLLGMHYTMAYSDYLTGLQVAMNAVQGKIEELSSKTFDELENGAEYAAARTATGQCIGIGEDRNCNGILNVGEDVNVNGVLDDPLRGGRFFVRIQPSPPAAVNPALLDVHVAACWTTRGRTVGEDRNCNGMLDAGEDVNGNGVIDSPAMASTRIAVKDD